MAWMLGFATFVGALWLYRVIMRVRIRCHTMQCRIKLSGLSHSRYDARLKIF